MNRHDIVTEDRRLEAIQLAQRWAKQNLISDTAARHIAAAHSSQVRQQPLLLRGIQFVGVFVAGLAFMVVFTTIVEANLDEYSNDALKATLFLCALAAGLVALTAMRRGYYTAGIDEGARGVAIVSTGLALCSLTDFDNINVFVGGLLLMAMAPAGTANRKPGFRCGHQLSAGLQHISAVCSRRMRPKLGFTIRGSARSATAVPGPV